MADPVVGITNGVPTSGTGTITTLGQTLVDGANATIGITTGAAVTTSAAGTLQQYLRGIVSLLVSGITVASHAVTNAGTFAVQVTSTVTTAVTQSGNWVIAAGSAIIGKVGIDQTTDLTTNKVRAFIHDGTTALTVLAGSSGAPAASVAALPVSLRDVNANGGATAANSAPVVNADQYGSYETVAASQTAQALGATGGTGDYLAGVLVFPGTAGCGVVTILDNATTIGTFAGGGTTALPSLVPFMIPVGLFSVSGAWKVTTGANVTAVGIGKFT